MSLLTINNLIDILQLNSSIADIENYKVSNYSNPYNNTNSNDYAYNKNTKINIQKINETIENVKKEQPKQKPDIFIDYLMTIFDTGNMKTTLKDIEKQRIQFWKWFELQINRQGELPKMLDYFCQKHKKDIFANIKNNLQKLYLLQIIANCLEIFFIIKLDTEPSSVSELGSDTHIRIMPSKIDKKLVGYFLDKDFNFLFGDDKTLPHNTVKYLSEYDSYDKFELISDKNKVVEIESYVKKYNIPLDADKKKYKKNEYLEVIQQYL